jgi:hypothetical protein
LNFALFGGEAVVSVLDSIGSLPIIGTGRKKHLAKSDKGRAAIPAAVRLSRFNSLL